MLPSPPIDAYFDEYRVSGIVVLLAGIAVHSVCLLDKWASPARSLPIVPSSIEATRLIVLEGHGVLRLKATNFAFSLKYIVGCIVGLVLPSLSGGQSTETTICEHQFLASIAEGLVR